MLKKALVIIMLVAVCGLGAIAGFIIGNKPMTDQELVKTYLQIEKGVDYDIEIDESDDPRYIEYTRYQGGDLAGCGTVLRTYAQKICKR